MLFVTYFCFFYHCINEQRGNSTKMKKVILILTTLLIGLASCGEEIVPNALIPIFDSILDKPTQLTAYDFLEDTPFKQIILPLDFGANRVKDSILLAKLKNAHIKYITYVYSDFKSDANFKQEELNRERLFYLYLSLLELSDAEDHLEIEWKVIEQTGADSEESAKQLFHGFVIYYRPQPTKESMQAEITFVDQMIDTALTYITPVSDTSLAVITEGEVGDKGFEIPYEDAFEETEVKAFDYGDYFVDTTVSASFNRNKHWDKMLVLCDLTGSMSPYSAQLLVWHRLNIDKRKTQYFVFFNDGDSTPDHKKIAGNTGGIYYSRADDFDQLQRIAYKCMSHGGGGDAPENDVEALLKGLNKCKNCGDVVLIADNWANMRDYKFINKIDRPVRIILCGTQLGVNIQYLELARATKGSVHTMEEDIDNLMDLREGEKVSIGKQNFLISEGRFIEVK